MNSIILFALLLARDSFAAWHGYHFTTLWSSVLPSILRINTASFPVPQLSAAWRRADVEGCRVLEMRRILVNLRLSRWSPKNQRILWSKSARPVWRRIGACLFIRVLLSSLLVEARHELISIVLSLYFWRFLRQMVIFREIWWTVLNRSAPVLIYRRWDKSSGLLAAVDLWQDSRQLSYKLSVIDVTGDAFTSRGRVLDLAATGRFSIRWASCKIC